MLAGLGVEANPYTSAVTVFAPFEIVLDDGSRLSFPLDLFRQGLVCQLPMETVLRIGRVIWRGDEPGIVTSENAAPLLGFVAEGTPVLYTEGYPACAVQRLMVLFGREGIVAEHWGDADLDGLRIGSTVRQYMPVSRVVAEGILAAPGGLSGIPLTEAQRRRLERYVAHNPDCPYLDALKRLMSGFWYEQESFPRDAGSSERK